MSKYAIKMDLFLLINTPKLYSLNSFHEQAIKKLLSNCIHPAVDLVSGQSRVDISQFSIIPDIAFIVAIMFGSARFLYYFPVFVVASHVIDLLWMPTRISE